MKVSPAIRYMLLAVLFFSLMNFGVKLASGVPAHEVVFVRALVSLIIALFLLRREGLNPWGNQKKLLLLRGFFGSVALILFFITLQNMPLATALTIQYLSPFFVALFGIFILNEKIKPLQWVLFALSFAGVIMIKGFDKRISTLMLVLGVLSALFSGLAYNMIRSMRDSDHPLVVVFYFPLVSLILSAFYSPFHWVWPDAQQWFFLILTGVFAQLGQIFMTRALHMEKANIIGSLNYLGVVFGLFFGFFWFGESYNWVSLGGILLVLTGVVLNLFLGSKPEAPKSLPSQS